MYTEVRERCVIENELQSGYCGSDNFVADHQRPFIIVWSLLRLAEFREGRNRLLYVAGFLATVVKTTVSRSDLSTFDMSAWDGCASTDLNQLFLPETYRRPQSSHSRTGFQPILLVHISHFTVNSPLVKIRSNGFHPPSPGGER